VDVAGTRGGHGGEERNGKDQAGEVFHGTDTYDAAANPDRQRRSPPTPIGPDAQ